MKIDIPPFDQFNSTLSAAKCPYDLFGENQPKTSSEVLEMLKNLRALSEQIKHKDIMTSMAFQKLETFLEWMRLMIILPSLGKYHDKKDYRVKLVIKVQMFEENKSFRLDYSQVKSFFNTVSAESFLGLWWHDKFEVVRDGKVVCNGFVIHTGGMSDCNKFCGLSTSQGSSLLATDFEVGDEIHIYTIKHHTGSDFMRRS